MIGLIRRSSSIHRPLVTPEPHANQSILSCLELKLYRANPPNGLIIFCGVIMLEDGKSEKKMTIDFEPFMPQTVFTYKCQNRFYTEPLQALL